MSISIEVMYASQTSAIASHQNTQLPTYGIGFTEPIWDEEFEGQLDRCDRAYVQFTIEAGCEPFFLSEVFLQKARYRLNADAIPYAILKNGSDSHLIYSVNDITKLPKCPSKVGAYSKKWRGRWVKALGDGRWIYKCGLLGYYQLTQYWVTRLEKWMSTRSIEVLLRVNPYSAAAPPVRLYDRDVVEEFINIHQAEIKKNKRRRAGHQ